MPKCRAIDPVLAPTVYDVADVCDVGDQLAERTWLEYDVVGSLHWKEPGIWEIYCGVQSPSRRREYRCYRIAARKRSTAIAGVVEAIASTFATTVILYHVRGPMTAEQIGFLQEFNARWDRQKGPLIAAFDRRAAAQLAELNADLDDSDEPTTLL